MRYLQAQVTQALPRQSITDMQVGFAGHITVVGDSQGGVFVFTTKLFDQYIRFRGVIQEKSEQGDLIQLYAQYVQDAMWSSESN